MDMLTVDLTPVPTARVGTAVELWGDGLPSTRSRRPPARSATNCSARSRRACGAGGRSFDRSAVIDCVRRWQRLTMAQAARRITSAPSAARVRDNGRASARTAAPGTRSSETTRRARGRATASIALAPAPAVPSACRDVARVELPRLATGIDEFDRVLGGGLVRGRGGADRRRSRASASRRCCCRRWRSAVAQRAVAVLYVSGEESAAAGRAARAAARRRRRGSCRCWPRSQLEQIRRHAEPSSKPEVAVIDSIQTLYSEALQSAPGSVAQVRECAAQLTRLAKQPASRVVLVGHVTKEGALAGPRVLEHMVDTVLYFEGDTHSSFRLVRAIKNRFGAVNELGVFAMTDAGCAASPIRRRCSCRSTTKPVAGSCVLVTQEGTRPLLVEIQALVDEAHAPQPAPAVGRPRAEPARAAARGAAPACRHRGLRPGRVRQCGRRRADRRAGGRPRGAAGDRLVAAQPAAAARSWWCSARSASPARCGRRSAARSGCARRPSSASRRR